MKMKKLFPMMTRVRTMMNKQVSHLFLIGAHRYTTIGGMCALRGPLRGADVCRGQPQGEKTFPLRYAGHTYPTQYFAIEILMYLCVLPILSILSINPSINHFAYLLSIAKSERSFNRGRVLAKRQKVRWGYGC